MVSQTARTERCLPKHTAASFLTRCPSLYQGEIHVQGDGSGGQIYRPIALRSDEPAATAVVPSRTVPTSPHATGPNRLSLPTIRTLDAPGGTIPSTREKTIPVTSNHAVSNQTVRKGFA